jgi:formylglycine-generating enzyme required for sulfatase activity
MRLGTAFAFVLATVLGLMQGRALIQAALVIDDVGDQNAHLLPNPMNDARDIAELIAADQEATTPLSAVEERVLKPKDNFKECAQCPEIVVVSSGSFTLGSPDSEEGRIEEEGPQHRVTFGSFWVGKFAVTFEEWDACVADGGCNGYVSSDEGWGRQRRPAIDVSREDAKTTWCGCRARPASPIDC